MSRLAVPQADTIVAATIDEDTVLRIERMSDGVASWARISMGAGTNVVSAEISTDRAHEVVRTVARLLEQRWPR